METTKKEILIKGIFNSEQAKEVVQTLFRSKIKMHSLSSFSSLVRNGVDSKEDTKRKDELKNSLKNLINCINENTSNDLYVKLDSVVKMKFVKKPKAKR